MRALSLGKPRPSSAGPSLRMLRLRARAPRTFLAVLVVVLCVAGVRSILSPRPTGARTVATGSGYDLGAGAFAQSFTEAYLTWGGEVSESQRRLALKPFLAEGIETNGGLAPAAKTNESVRATQVAEESSAGAIIDVLVVAETTNGTQYVSVPVARGGRGLLTVVSYPALVGPPATDTARTVPAPQPVDDQALETVVSRALGNYLAGHTANLRADLTPSAIVSLPNQALELREIGSVTWLVPNHTVNAQVEVKEEQGTRLTLTYQVGVTRHDRWYVSSIQFDPTLRGGM